MGGDEEDTGNGGRTGGQSTERTKKPTSEAGMPIDSSFFL